MRLSFRQLAPTAISCLMLSVSPLAAQVFESTKTVVGTGTATQTITFTTSEEALTFYDEDTLDATFGGAYNISASVN